MDTHPYVCCNVALYFAHLFRYKRHYIKIRTVTLVINYDLHQRMFHINVLYRHGVCTFMPCVITQWGWPSVSDGVQLSCL